MSIGIEIALMEILKWPFYRQFVERIRFNWSGLKLKAQVGDAERWETNKKQMFDHEKFLPVAFILWYALSCIDTVEAILSECCVTIWRAPNDKTKNVTQGNIKSSCSADKYHDIVPTISAILPEDYMCVFARSKIQGTASQGRSPPQTPPPAAQVERLEEKG